MLKEHSYSYAYYLVFFRTEWVINMENNMHWCISFSLWWKKGRNSINWNSINNHRLIVVTRALLLTVTCVQYMCLLEKVWSASVVFSTACLWGCADKTWLKVLPLPRMKQWKLHRSVIPCKIIHQCLVEFSHNIDRTKHFMVKERLLIADLRPVHTAQNSIYNVNWK